MIKLTPIKEDTLNHEKVVYLYQLLGERTPDQSISHKEMPSIGEHIRFLESNPYEE